MIELWPFVAAGAIAALWHVGHTWAASKGVIAALETRIATVEAKAEARCDKNTQALENLTKQVLEKFTLVEAKMVAVGITRPPKHGAMAG